MQQKQSLSRFGNRALGLDPAKTLAYVVVRIKVWRHVNSLCNRSAAFCDQIKD